MRTEKHNLYDNEEIGQNQDERVAKLIRVSPPDSEANHRLNQRQATIHIRHLVSELPEIPGKFEETERTQLLDLLMQSDIENLLPELYPVSVVDLHAFIDLMSTVSNKNDLLVTKFPRTIWNDFRNQLKLLPILSSLELKKEVLTSLNGFLLGNMDLMRKGVLTIEIFLWKVTQKDLFIDQDVQALFDQTFTTNQWQLLVARLINQKIFAYLETFVEMKLAPLFSMKMPGLIRFFADHQSTITTTVLLMTNESLLYRLATGEIFEDEKSQQEFDFKFPKTMWTELWARFIFQKQFALCEKLSERFHTFPAQPLVLFLIQNANHVADEFLNINDEISLLNTLATGCTFKDKEIQQQFDAEFTKTILSEVLIKLKIEKQLAALDTIRGMTLEGPGAESLLECIKSHFLRNSTKILPECLNTNSFLRYLQNHAAFTDSPLQAKLRELLPVTLLARINDPKSRGLVFFSVSNFFEYVELNHNGIDVLDSTTTIPESVRPFYEKLVSRKEFTICSSKDNPKCWEWTQELLMKNNLNQNESLLSVKKVEHPSDVYQHVEKICVQLHYVLTSLPEYFEDTSQCSEAKWNTVCISRLLDAWFVHRQNFNREYLLPYTVFLSTPLGNRLYRPKLDAAGSLKGIPKNLVLSIAFESKKSSQSAEKSSPLGTDITKLALIAKSNLHTASLCFDESVHSKLCFLSLYHEGSTMKVYMSYFIDSRVKFHEIAVFNISIMEGQFKLICLLLNAIDYYGEIDWGLQSGLQGVADLLTKSTSLRGSHLSRHNSSRSGAASPHRQSGAGTPNSSILPIDLVRLKASGYHDANIYCKDHANICLVLNNQGNEIVCKKVHSGYKEHEFLSRLNTPEQRQEPANRAVRLLDVIDCQNDHMLLLFPKHFPFVDQFGTKYTRPKVVIERTIQQLQQFVHYLHGLGISHRDIKPRNLALDSNDDLVVLDFGLSMEGNVETRDGNGTEGYVPDDFLGGKKKYRTFDLDDYALQQTIAELRENFIEESVTELRKGQPDEKLNLLLSPAIPSFCKL